MQSLQPKRSWLILLVVAILVTAAVTFAVAALLVSIFERKQEAKNPFMRLVEIDDNTVDPAIWGKNFPYEYDGYKRTIEMRPTRFGGSEAFPRIPTNDDPRTVVAYSRLDTDPRLKEIWAGYAFAVDFRKKRGHAYMLEDQTYTERVHNFKQPGTCLNCHASVYTIYKDLGGGDIIAGFDKLNQMTYPEARKLVSHPVSCLDCHDPGTMQLRITRPAFIEGIKTFKEAKGVKNFTLADATRQEMRSYVCAQCHVEYYFKGKEKRLVYPWSKGQKGDQILAYYDESGFADWTHELTGAPMLKAQHPEFELWGQGTHARAGVACADCHMPYNRVGSLKVSDHHVRSPLLNIAHACQTCHHVEESELRARAESLQERTMFARNLAMDALVALIAHLKDAKDKGLAAKELSQAQQYHRQAQFLIDFVEAENSNGFHAGQESLRLLAQALDYCRQGELVIAGK